MVEIKKVSENTWHLEKEGVRFFLLTGAEKALLLDTGMNCPEARQLAEGLTSLPLFLMNTHADPDHISGNGAFSECYMHPDEEANYRSFHGSCDIVAIRDGECLDLGGRCLRILSIPGHTPGSIALLDETNRVLYSGDSVQNGLIFMFGPARNPKDYLNSLKKLEKMEGAFDCICPSHGDAVVMPDIIPELIQAVEDMLDGKVQGKPVNAFGIDAVKYTFDCASFLMER